MGRFPGSADGMSGWWEQRQCVETLFGVRNVDQADFERRIWIVSSEAVGDHCSDIVSGDVDLLVPECSGQLVNINRDHAVVLREFRHDLMELPPSLGPAR